MGPYGFGQGGWFLLWVDFGPRTQGTAATLIARSSQGLGSCRCFSQMGHTLLRSCRSRASCISPASWAHRAETEAPARGSQRPVLRSGGQGPQQDGPGREGQ
jgi:hypothetical protein